MTLKKDTTYELRLPTPEEIAEFMDSAGAKFDDGSRNYAIRDSIVIEQKESKVLYRYLHVVFDKATSQGVPLWDTSIIHVVEDREEMVRLAKGNDYFPPHCFIIKEDEAVYKVEYNGMKRILKRKEHLDKFVQKVPVSK
jgi:hypothetical protein